MILKDEALSDHAGLMRKSIEEQYDRMNPTEGNELTSLRVALSVGPATAERNTNLEQENSPPKNQDLKGIFRRSSDAFLHWQSLYEKGSVGD